MRIPLLALVTLTACGHHHHGSDGGTGIPLFFEVERNDDPLTANHFGVLRPGDRFVIEGNVRDDLADPFDGFAFTAGGPLHVDFALSVRNAADLDVCLYDPQLDETVACFATADNPELGGVDVTAGGLDFHLVVESFAGDATYRLEIAVLSLFARAPLVEGESGGLSASGARAEHEARAPRDYREPAPASRLVIEQSFDFVPELGLWIERRVVRTESAQ